MTRVDQGELDRLAANARAPLVMARRQVVDALSEACRQEYHGLHRARRNRRVALEEADAEGLWVFSMRASEAEHALRVLLPIRRKAVRS